jgi:Zn-finger nucleic acid-binding protein
LVQEQNEPACSVVSTRNVELYRKIIMKCPRCGSALSVTEYDGEQVEVCSGCKGEWLQAGELEKILEHHDEVFTPEEIASLDAVNKEVFTNENLDHDELNCPQCANARMEHFNYSAQMPRMRGHLDGQG